MTFAQSISTVYRKFATFSGRAPRSEFWWYMLFDTLVSVSLDFISTSLANMWDLANILPSIAVACRRLHDIDKSGWWQLLPLAAAPILLAGFVKSGLDFVDYFSWDNTGTPLFWGGAIVAFVLYVFLIVWFATPGTAGPNRYGDDPSGRTDASVFE